MPRAARHVRTMISGDRSKPTHLLDHGAFDLGSRHAPHRAGVGVTLEHVRGDVIAVELAALPRVRGRHRPAGRPENQSLQQGRRLRPRSRGALPRAVGQDAVDLVPQRLTDDRFMLARIDRALVHGLSDVGAVVQELVDVALVDELAVFAGDALGAQRAHQRGGRADLGEPLEDHADRLGVRFVDDELAVLDVVAERHEAAHPHALLAGGRELVADALADHLALELGERQQDVERQPPHRRGGVERLRHADEGDAVAVEHLDQLGEIHQRAAEAVDLVDHHHVDAAGLDVGEQPLQRRAFQRRAGDAAVVVAVGHQHPAFGLLAGDVGLAGLALGIERVELLLQAFLAGLAGVDRAAEFADDRLFHGRASRFLRPKKSKPIPARAGDGARDRRQRFVRPALIFEILVAHRDAVLDALVFADEPRAGDRPFVGGLPAPRRVATVELLAELAQALQRFGLETAVGQLLNPIGEPVLQEAPVIRWRLVLEELAPFLLQRADRRGLQGGQLGQNRIGHSKPPFDVRTLA